MFKFSRKKIENIDPSQIKKKYRINYCNFFGWPLANPLIQFFNKDPGPKLNEKSDRIHNKVVCIRSTGSFTLTYSGRR
jgi:hypothetical protein